MAKKSYHVVDSSGKKIGVLFLADAGAPQQNTSIFESISPTIQSADVPIQQTVEKSSFWQSDGIKYTICGMFAGTVILTYAWWTDSNLGALAAAAAIVCGVGLHLIKILRMHPPAQPIATQEAETVIKIESVSEDRKRMQIDYIEDESISADELRRVAVAWIDGVSFARQPMVKAANISNDKYRKILSEFQRLNLVHTSKNNHNELSLRGKALMRQLSQ